MEYLPSLAKEGVLGLLLAGALVIIGILFKLLLYEKDKRIEDALKSKNDIIEPIGYIKDSLSIIKDKILVSKGRR